MPLEPGAGPLPGAAPTRVAVAGDWHGDAMFGVEAVHYAAEHGAQAILHAGDFGPHGAAQINRYLDILGRALTATGLWLAWVDGNHDDHWWIRRLPFTPAGVRQCRPSIVQLPRGYRWVWHDRTWLALGGAVSMDRAVGQVGVSWWPEETITHADAATAIDDGPAWAMLTHDAPAGVDIPFPAGQPVWPEAELRGTGAHRALLRQVVEEVRPVHLWHGHMHVRYDALLRLDRNADERARRAAPHTTEVHGLGCNGRLTPEAYDQNMVIIDPAA